MVGATREMTKPPGTIAVPGGFEKIPAMTDFRARGTIMGLAGLTAVFGMGTGGAPPVWSPEIGRGAVRPPRPRWIRGGRSRTRSQVVAGGSGSVILRGRGPRTDAGSSVMRGSSDAPTGSRPPGLAGGGRIGVVKPLGC